MLQTTMPRGHYATAGPPPARLQSLVLPLEMLKVLMNCPSVNLLSCFLKAPLERQLFNTQRDVPQPS